jgi:glycine/D-amino acid oxidase-like deaminating enzyme
MDWCGTLWVAADAAELAHVAAKQQAYAAVGIATEILDARALAEAEPNLRPLAGALRVPSDGVLYPPAAARWLVDQARARGATLRTGCTVDAIVDHGVRIGTETLHAETIVNAAGAAAARLTPELPIVPRKGHLVITDRYPGFCRHQLVELGYLASAHVMTNESVAFNVQPRRTGQVLIGSSRELVGWDASINPTVLRAMLDRARRFMPALAEVSVLRTWTGFRPTTPDKLPLIGPWPAVAGLWVAAGHEGLGITTSLGSAALLADLVVGARPAIEAAPFAPLRTVDAAVVH